MINISALYDVVMWATNCERVHGCFTFRNKCGKPRGDVMIGGAICDTVLPRVVPGA